jgi:uncharacterized membrane protein (DUF2068 family)
MRSTPEPLRGPKKPAGVRAVILYKTVKAVVQLGLAVVLFVAVLTGAAEHVQEIAASLRHHASSALSLRAADLLMRGATRRHIELTSVALAFDGVLSFVEGWALRMGHWWGPWLVVVASGSLLPFEVYAVTQHLRLGRVVVILVNLAIVVYLAKRALIEHRERVKARHGP